MFSAALRLSDISKIKMLVLYYFLDKVVNNPVFILFFHSSSIVSINNLKGFNYSSIDFSIHLNTRTHGAGHVHTFNVCTFGCGRFQFNDYVKEFLGIFNDLVSFKRNFSN